jgi:hypothetical protein
MDVEGNKPQQAGTTTKLEKVNPLDYTTKLNDESPSEEAVHTQLST